MKRLAIYLSGLVGGVVCFAGMLYGMSVATDLLLPDSIEAPPGCATADCAADRRQPARPVCRAA